MSLYRDVFCTRNEWTLLIDGTARAAIEAAMASLIEPGDPVLVASFGRFGQLKTEIARRCGARVEVIDKQWGQVFAVEEIEAALRKFSPKLVALCQGDTSTTMLQPLADVGPLCKRYGAMVQVDATASLGGTPLPVDAWQIDVATAGLQKCLGGPSGSAPITFSDEAGNAIYRRRHIEEGLRAKDYVAGSGPIITSNYFDLAMVMDYWSDRALNHHTESTTMLYGARECARVLLAEGLEPAFTRHALAGGALVAGVEAMGLQVFGDKKNKLPHVTGIWIPAGVDGERVRNGLLQHFNIEIGTSFGPLHGKIWRVGTMGYNARKDCVLITLAALESVLAAEGVPLKRGAAVDAALAAYAAA
jgi:(S)-ureidoglycine-glyoxylate aminotransferase